MSPLSSKDLKNKFLIKIESSGISSTVARKLHLETFTATEAKKLNVLEAAGIKIPYFDIRGKELKFYRVRFLEDTKKGFAKQTSGKSQKYSQPPDSGVEVYLPPITNWMMYSKQDTPLIITEGEFKAAACTLRGKPTIGLGGVSSFRGGKKYGNKPLHPTLEQFNYKGRLAYIIYDSDAVRNPQVAAAENALCRELLRFGAIPVIVRLPDLSKDGKTGLDDYLLAKTDEEFDALLLSAKPYKLGEELHKLNEEVVFVRDPGLVYAYNNQQKMAPGVFVESIYATRTFVQETPTATGTKRTIVSAPKEWIKWPGRAEVERIVYKPGQPRITNEHCINMWEKPKVRAIKGDVAPWKQLLDFVFASEPEHRRWFEQWCAYPLQYPGTKLFSAIVMWGLQQGTGKTLLGYTLMRLYGKNAIEIGNEDLQSADNDYAENKQFVVGEEIAGGDKRGVADRLKSLITRETIRVNVKYVPKYTIDDCINYYFTSNHLDAFYLDKHDRRFFVHEIRGTPLDTAFYKKYDTWYKGVGLDALYYHLLTLDTSDFEPRGRPPMTRSKQDMIHSGMSELDSWTQQLKDDPDTILRLGDKIIGYALWTAEALRLMYDPDEKKRVTVIGVAKALQKAGFERPFQNQGCRTSEGNLRIWVIRDQEKFRKLTWVELGKTYDDERKASPAKKSKFAKGGQS